MATIEQRVDVPSFLSSDTIKKNEPVHEPERMLSFTELFHQGHTAANISPVVRKAFGGGTHFSSDSNMTRAGLPFGGGSWRAFFNGLRVIVGVAIPMYVLAAIMKYGFGLPIPGV